jgi:transcriptional regulator with XRE-family HTH domain
MTYDELISRIKILAVRTGSQAALADRLDVTPSYLNDVLLGRRMPGTKILEALNIKKVITYERLK